MKEWLKDKFLPWLKAAGIRALKTVAEAFIAMIGTSVFLNDVDWKQTLSASALAGILSLAWSIKGLPELKESDFDA